ncbi:N6-adenosine-specific RNA methylase IME4 [Rhodovulum sp. ES.010]|uniref:MT-A70 family methyltransferase n=1 Tax=Rhodovulum sp. ES.010 TaxID=1882821 RepID=UPI00092A413C|nr:MT-A70 family methyltransferase [Rhodovulum sp. ES.010]SIO36755.1 N6-adenosine-specific RNA methylase IME4 [Rhodovulum sp. ES.010]
MAGRGLVQEFIALRPTGGFNLIMADPPWSFDNWSAAGEAKNAKAHYACTPLGWIEALPVSVLAAENCLLWLWATNPMLREAFAVLDAWAFEYKAAGHWSKRNPATGKLAFGTGYIFRNAGEPYLVGVRGAPRTTRSVRSVIEGAARAHSRKPDEAYAAAEALMPGARRIELFSRTDRPGWAVWGDEAGKFGEAA